MDLTFKQEVGVGAIVLIGVAVFLVGMFYLTGRSLRAGGISVDVMFQSVAGLKQGDPVLVSGVKKGRVARVALERVKSVRVTLELTKRSEEHTSELQSPCNLVCRLLLEKKKKKN